MATSADNKQQLLALIRDNPFISQQDLADQLGLSRSAVAGHIASLIREHKLLGRAYVLPSADEVVCLGGANLDRKLQCRQSLQMASSNPVSGFESCGGVARNIARNLANLGSRVQLISSFGYDAAAEVLLSDCAKAGINTGASLRTHVATGSYTALLDQHGELVLGLAQMDGLLALDPSYLSSQLGVLQSARLVIADLNLSQASIAYLLELRQLGKIKELALVAVSQPKMAHLPRPAGVLDILILNQAELASYLQVPLEAEEQLLQACKTMHQHGVRQMVVSRGSAGLCLSLQNHAPQFFAAATASVVDVTGAGDALSAALCWSLLNSPERDLPAWQLACRRGLALAQQTLASPHSVVAEPGLAEFLRQLS